MISTNDKRLQIVAKVLMALGAFIAAFAIAATFTFDL